MPNRIVKESITTSATLAALSAEAERFFLRLTVVVDDYGRMDARPCILRAKCFAAMLDAVSERKVATWLGALAEAGLVRCYDVDGRPYLEVTTWEQHQRVRAKVSKCPPPSADIGGHPRSSADIRGQMSPGSGSGSGTGSGTGTGTSRDSESRGFGVFWLAYLKKRHKPDALKAWQQVHGDDQLDAILAGLDRWKASEAWLRGYIEDPATFLRQRQWEDAPQRVEASASDRAAQILADLQASRKEHG
jgi:hypothetical protein